MMGSRSWYRIEAKADNPAEADVYIYEEIGFWGVTAKQFIDEVKALAVEQINLRLNTLGGDVFDGTAIYNVLRAHKARVITYIDGVAASMGSIIALAGDEVKMADNAFFMIHNPWGLTLGDAEDFRDYAEFLDKITDTLSTTYANKTGMEPDEVKALMDKETWFTAAEAHEAGFVDEVIPSMKVAACASFDPGKFKHAPEGLFESDTLPSKVQLERTLRDAAGLSRTEAKAFVSQGYSGLAARDARQTDQRDAGKPTAGKDKEEIPMTKDELKAKHPEVFDAIHKEGADSVDLESARAEARREGAAAEAQRVKDVRAQLVPGFESIIEGLVADGQSTGDDAAKAIIAAQQKMHADKRQDISDDAKNLLVGSDAPKDGGDGVDPNLPLAERCKAQWDRDPKVRAEFLDNFDSYLAYMKAEGNGRVKVLKTEKEGK